MEDCTLIYLDEVINKYLDQYRLPESAYSRISTLAIRGRKELHLHSCGKPVEVPLEILANNVALIPADYLNKIGVYVANYDGRKVSLREDSGLSLNGHCDKSFPESEPQYFDGSPILTRRQYGRGGGDGVGSYRIDEENKVILFNPSFGYDEVYLEYLPQAQNDGDYIVHPLFEETLINWIAWQDSRGDKKVSAGTVRENERIYWNSHRLSRRAMKPFDPSQVFISYRKTLSQAPRA